MKTKEDAQRISPNFRPFLRRFITEFCLAPLKKPDALPITRSGVNFLLS
jgi:hypothetical protein